jgi:hypothetical protein
VTALEVSVCFMRRSEAMEQRVAKALQFPKCPPLAVLDEGNIAPLPRPVFICSCRWYSHVHASALCSGLCFGVVVVRPWSATVGKSSSVFIARTVLRAAALTSRVSLHRAPWFSELRVLVRVSASGSGLLSSLSSYGRGPRRSTIPLVYLSLGLG